MREKIRNGGKPKLDFFRIQNERKPIGFDPSPLGFLAQSSCLFPGWLLLAAALRGGGTAQAAPRAVLPWCFCVFLNSTGEIEKNKFRGGGGRGWWVGTGKTGGDVVGWVPGTAWGSFPERRSPQDHGRERHSPAACRNRPGSHRSLLAQAQLPPAHRATEPLPRACTPGNAA